MPFTVQDLVQDKKPVTVKLDDSVRVALQRMFGYDFSQLPVVNEDNKPLGTITMESILRAQDHFGLTLDKLNVSAALVRADEFRNDANLFDLLDKLRDTNAVLIVDGKDQLIGIVTSYDAMEYFRRRAEDMMLVEDIESTLREYILAAFAISDEEIDEDKLNEAIQEILSSDTDIQNNFRAALFHYLNAHNTGQQKIPVNSKLVDEVVAEHLSKPQKTKSFEDLTLNEFITLFLHKSRWTWYEPIFKIDRQALHKLLDGVRQTRNILAHFRGEITTAQRDQLRFCYEWLGRFQKAVAQVFSEISTKQASALPLRVAEQVAVYNTVSAITPTEEEISPNESRYAALAIWLQSQPADERSVSVTFEQVENIIGGPLPESAYNHRAWWTNDSVSHIQSQKWLDAGWRVSYINMSEQRVKFVRIREREKAYIDFFSILKSELEQQASFPFSNLSPSGVHWFTVTYLPYDGKRIAALSFSFTRQKQFRIELYIDVGNQAENKRIFDHLHHRRAEIEAEFGNRLSWERLNENRASRVGKYFDGAITDDEAKLTELRRQAVKTMIQFEQVIRGPFEEAIRER